MSLFSTNNINMRCTVREGNYHSWRINLTSDTWISLSIHRVDGYGPTLYVIPDDELYNFKKGLTFKHVPDLHFENIEEFQNKVILARGMYHIITTLPEIPDDRNSISEFNIRYEVVK